VVICVITIARNPVHYNRTNHRPIDIKYYYVLHILQEGKVSIEHIPTEFQPADILTKKLDHIKHRRALRNMGFLRDEYQTKHKRFLVGGLYNRSPTNWP
jgi:hypothetical protein